jgi:LPXTG-site transpeptidase (sortase) family protein
VSDPVDVETGKPLTRGSKANTPGLVTHYVDAPGDALPRTVAPPDVAEPPDGSEASEQAGPTAPSVAEASDEASAALVAPARTRPPSTLLWIGLFASTLGLCALLFVVYVDGFSSLQQHREQRILLNAFTSSDRAKLLTGRGIAEGQPAGVLTIPAIGLRQVLVQGTNATDLLKGPGLMPGTAPPGSLGNAVIAGHRTIAGSPFARIGYLQTGDRIQVVTPHGSYRYRVIAVGSARPGAHDPTSPNRHPRLTLVTSGSGGDGRLYVVASLVTTPNDLRIPRVPPSSSERGLSGDAAAVLPSILWGLLLAAGFAATLWAYQRYRGRHWTVYLLSTPVLLALTFVWYGNLVRLLPGTM